MHNQIRLKFFIVNVLPPVFLLETIQLQKHLAASGAYELEYVCNKAKVQIPE